jgi:hypothetical protein
MGMADVEVRDGLANSNMRALINDCWTISRQYLPVVIIPEGDPREIIFRTILVDDSRESGSNWSEWKSTLLI